LRGTTWRRLEPGLYELPPGKDGKPRFAAEWVYQGRKVRRRFPTVTLARQALYAVRGQIIEGRYIDRRKEAATPFNEAVKTFLQWSEINTRPTTHRRDKEFAAGWVAFFGGKTLGEITPGEVERFKTAEAVRPRKGGIRPICKKSVDNSLARLKRLFNLCIESGLCSLNPVSRVKFFRPESRKDRFLSPEEAETLLAQTSEPTVRAAILFSIHTGLRLGELLSLTWADVDFSQGAFGQITIRAARAKGKRSRRVPLDRTARQALDSLPRGIRGDALVFQRFGGRYNSCLRKTFEKAVKAADLEGASWHTLRHTSASWLVMAGTPLVIVQRILGHRAIETTLRYAHLAPGFLEEAVTALDRFGKKSVNMAPSASEGGTP